MATLHTARAIVVARAAFAAKANLAAKTVDTLGGEFTFTVPLRVAGDVTNTAVAYICNWAFTQAEITAMRQALRDQGAKVSEVAVITAADKATYTPNPADQCYVFDARWEAASWTPAEVLTVLGLDTLASTL